MPYAEQLLRQAADQKISERPAWRRLLHDRRSVLGIYESDVDDPHFFIARNGRKNPDAELRADLNAFFDPIPSGAQTQQPQCRFPARYAWLKDQLHFDPQRLPEAPCARFEAWAKNMDPASATVVFASYYMNNPASMYGHTFLRLNRPAKDDTRHLLDYVVNYAADSQTANGPFYAVLGLTGGYRGRFSTMPYYIKVQEYNNLESRDLWEYDLNLSAPQIHRLVQHLWELGGSSIAYFFLNRNCSYQLLPLLEVADPALNVSKSFIFRAVPVDTLRALLAQPGLVTRVRRRASHVNVLLAERSQLSVSERAAAQALARAKRPREEWRRWASGIAVARRPTVLRVAYDYFRYRVGFKRPQPSAVAEREQQLLLLQNALSRAVDPRPTTAEDDYNVFSAASSPWAILPVRSRNTAEDDGEVSSSSAAVGRGSIATLAPSTVVSPDKGHATGRVGLSYGFSNRSHFEEISLRPAAHDQDDPSLGYIPYSQLQMFPLKLRYDNDRKTFYPEQFLLVDLTSLSPWDAWVHHLSWKVNTGLNVADDLPRDPENSLYWGLDLGSGFSFPLPGWNHSLLYTLAVMDSGVGHPFRDAYRWGGGGAAGLFFQVTPAWRTHVEAQYIDYLLGNPGSITEWRAIESFSLTSHCDLRATLQRKNQYKEILLSALWYL